MDFFVSQNQSTSISDSYRVDAIVFYSQQIYDKFGSDAGVRERVAGVVGRVNIVYSDPSLTTKVHLNVTSVVHLKGQDWTATGHNLG